MSADAIANLWRRVQLAIGRGRIQTVDDSGQVQKLQVKLGADETVDGVPRLAHYGFQSVPPQGSDAVVVFLAGERSNGVVIACGNQTYRMRSLATGEVAISDDKGQSIYLSAAGIRIDGGGRPIAISNTPDLTMTADAVTINGPTTINGDVSLAGGLAQTGTGAVTFDAIPTAPDFATPSLTIGEHRHNNVKAGSDKSGGAISLT